MEQGAPQAMPQRRALIGLAGAGIALVVLSPLALHFLFQVQYENFVLVALCQCAAYAVSVWLILRWRLGRAALWLIFAVAIVARAIALPAPPTLSTDVARYVWDGRVQAAGINPYRYIPADQHLAPLRDQAIYPNINRADYAPTIYPPAAQMIFLAVTRLSETLTAMRLAMIGFEVVTVLALLALLRHDGQPAERVLIYAWHPLPIWEFAGTGHVDAAALAFMTLAMLAAVRERRALAGVALAAGALVKPFVLVVAPALWKRWDRRLPVALVAAAVLLYLPYLGAGSGVFGYLGGYGEEQHYEDGSGFFLVALLKALGLPSPGGLVFAIFAALVLGTMAVHLVLRERGSDPWMFLPLAAGFCLLISPHYAWYFAWLLPLLVRAPYVPLIYLTLASFIFYLPAIKDFDRYFLAGLWLYGGLAMLAVVDLALRRRAAPARRPA